MAKNLHPFDLQLLKVENAFDDLIPVTNKGIRCKYSIKYAHHLLNPSTNPSEIPLKIDKICDSTNDLLVNIYCECSIIQYLNKSYVVVQYGFQDIGIRFLYIKLKDFLNNRNTKDIDDRIQELETFCKELENIGVTITDNCYVEQIKDFREKYKQLIDESTKLFIMCDSMMNSFGTLDWKVKKSI
jgi:hypothetical protein